MLIATDIDWQKQADVVIIGYGMAGAVAAISASEAGVSVLLVEKQSKNTICNTSSMSGGGFICSSDVEGATKYLEALNKVNGDIAWTESDIIRIWAERSAENKEWLESKGVKVKFNTSGGQHPDLPGAESIKRYSCAGSGMAMMRRLYEYADSKGIDVLYDTAASKILTNQEGKVVGVQAIFQSKVININAGRAVVLSCGGFEYNEEMKLNYLKMYPSYFDGATASTGDGIKMAIDVGAELWHMNCCAARAVAKYPDFPIPFSMEFGGPNWSRRLGQRSTTPEMAGYIVVDKYGKRFASENFKVHCFYYDLGLYDSQKLEFPRIPSHWIFDQRRMDAGPLVSTGVGPAGPHQLYKWSHDNKVELERGWVTEAASVSVLAKILRMETETLQSTIDTYNQYCQNGVDSEFERRSCDLIPLTNPPFYTVKLWPGGSNTQGGPKRNGKAQILNTEGEPIQGLYGAGELGSLFGMIYPAGGGNLSECISFGRIAGENAANSS